MSTCQLAQNHQSWLAQGYSSYFILCWDSQIGFSSDYLPWKAWSSQYSCSSSRRLQYLCQLAFKTQIEKAGTSIYFCLKYSCCILSSSLHKKCFGITYSFLLGYFLVIRPFWVCYLIFLKLIFFWWIIVLRILEWSGLDKNLKFHLVPTPLWKAKTPSTRTGSLKPQPTWPWTLQFLKLK